MMKKQQIMEKALELFATNGIQGTSIQQITDSCHISKGAFYLHFTSKDELILELIIHYTNLTIAYLEQAVSESHPKEHLLYHYFYAAFTIWVKQVDFAHLFIKELMTSHNANILETLKGYYWVLNKLIHTVVERQFHYINPRMYADLVFVIQGFTYHYSTLFVPNTFQIDIGMLCKTLVEKITAIAENAKNPFVTTEFLYFHHHGKSLTKEELILLIDKAVAEIDKSQIIQESLHLLKENLLEPTLHEAIIHGLLKNIKTNPQCVSVAYLYELWLDEKLLQ